LHIFWEKVQKNLSRLFEFKLATNKTLGYDMPRPKLKTRQLSYRKEDHAMRPIYGCTEKF